ncbi:HAD family phosphatase [Porphyromonadaceae sp. NP-X]|jgi:2-haloacid dehalogenase|nr:HAD family phosphatase [Porphyromonadaceae sp. NP-X]
MEILKNVVFDFGGVLIDWNPRYLYRNVFRSEDEMEYFLEHICPYDWNLMQDAGRSLAEATLLKQEEHPEYSNEIALYYGRWIEMIGGIFDENVKLLKPLKEKYNLYGLTNWSAETLPLAQAEYDFFDLFDEIVVSGAEKIVKPDPELYRILIDRYRINPQETLFIDDNPENIQTAKQLGFQTLHLTPQINLEQELKSRGIID